MRKVVTAIMLFVLAQCFAANAQSPPALSKTGTVSVSQEQTVLLQKDHAGVLNAPFVNNVKGHNTQFRSPRSNVSALAMRKADEANVALPDLHGCVIARTDWTSSTAAIGLYTLPAAQGDEFVLDISGVNATQGGVPVNGVYYATNSYSFGTFVFVTISGYDLETGQMTGALNTSNPEAICFDSTVDPLSNRVYALTYNSTQTAVQLSEITYKNPVEVRAIALLDGYWNAIAADNAGSLYGIRKIMSDDVCVGSELVLFNKDNGSYTVIGQTGEAPKYVSSATIDPDTNRMYWTVSNEAAEGFLCEVDLSTGVATRIMDFPASAEVTGLYVKPKGGKPLSPAKAENVSASFPAGSLQGTVSFDIPALLIDGSAAQGQVSYRVEADGRTLADGTASYGDHVSVPLQVEATGMTEFSVVLSNDAGDSPAATVTVFVGTGVPEAPKDVTVNYSDGYMHIEWMPVAASADGGYIDPDGVTYTVTGYPGNVQVASGMSGTKVSHPVAEPEELTKYKYGVTATYDGKTSAEGVSNSVVLGVAYPPYTASIESADDMGSFYIIDGNEDGIRWSYNNQAAYVMSNNRLAADDWLITVPVNLESGYVYYIGTEVYGTPFTDERFELKAGMAPTAEAMTHTIVEPTEIHETGQSRHYGGYFTPDVSGRYYIGLHAISSPLQFALYTKEISISEGEAAAKPAAGQLVATPSPAGDYQITLNMTAPTRDLSDNAVGPIIKSELYRGETLIHTCDAPKAGSSWEYVDNLGEKGIFTYRFVSYTTGGEGMSVSATGYSGTDKPAKVSGLSVREEAPGNVRISWDVVDKDHNGNTINPEKVKYSIFTLNEDGQVEKAVVENISETVYSFEECKPDAEQYFVQYALAASSEGGLSAVASEMIPVGKAYSGMEESFTNAQTTYLFGTDSFGTSAVWALADNMTFLNVKPYDNDNGYIYLNAGYIGDRAEFFTGKISLEGMKTPALRFYIRPVSQQDTNLLTVKALEPGGEYITLLSKDICELGTPAEWSQVIVPLSDFEGKVVQLCINAVANAYPYVVIDKMDVGPLVDYDLKVSGISAPATVASGYEFNVDVTVGNKGLKASGPFSLELYADGELAATLDCESIEPEQAATCRLKHTMKRFYVDEVAYTAKINYDLDEVPENNVSPEIYVCPEDPLYPAVSDLDGLMTEAGVHLSWTAPDLYSPDRPIKETFEDAASWTDTLKDWIFIDGDGAAAGGVAGSPIPGVIPGRTSTSFFVFDYTDGDWGSTFSPVSGNKFLATLFREDNGLLDDWAISPELTGEAQTIKFWAKSYRDIYPEMIEVYYSTGGTDISDFVMTEDGYIEKVPAEWTQYSVKLPKGASRFAIRSCAAGSFILMMDDFEFIAAGVNKGLEIKGYDIYRDCLKANEALCAECDWTDTDSNNEEHTYTVIPVYNKGEGKSSDVTVKVNALSVAETGIIVSVLDNRIIISGAEGSQIYVVDASGMSIFSGIGRETTVIPAHSGVYILKAGTEVRKVIVP